MDITELKASLRELGVTPGMNLMVHSSLSSMGFVEGGAETVVRALTEVITPAGTLMMPSFNHNRCYWRGEIFDVNSTPTINGAVPEFFRKQPDVLRSENPTHAFAAWGKNAPRYILEHRLHSPMGYDSPMYRLMEDDGWCLLMGVDYRVNTFHHCVEICEKVHCMRDIGEEYDIIGRDGRPKRARTWSWRDGVCPVNDLGLYSEAMAPFEKTGYIGNAYCRLYRLRDAYPVIAGEMRTYCPTCALRPRQNENSI